MRTVKQYLNNLEIEEIRTPFMLIDNKLVKFTNIKLVCNCSGDEFFIMFTKQNKLKVLKTSVDFDCDGTFYSACFVNIFSENISNYTVDNHFNKIESGLMNLLFLSNVI